MPVLSKSHFYFSTVSRAVKYRRRRTKQIAFSWFKCNISASILLPSVQLCSVFIYVVISPSVAPFVHLCSLVRPSLMCYTCVCPLTPSSVKQSPSDKLHGLSVCFTTKVFIIKRMNKYSWTSIFSWTEWMFFFLFLSRHITAVGHFTEFTH